MNTALVKPPSDQEIKKAVDEINLDKAPGPDGMTGLFYQLFWEVTAREVIAMVKYFFLSNSFDPSMNQTNICLIPKTERPMEMTEFRPISLCNVSYKIISKIICSRLKKFLPKLISETQSAFVARRLISDNILLAQEAFHALRTNPMCKAKYMAIKTDMSKTYDRVKWCFLEALLLKMGFADKWVSWIHWCVSSISYQILLNGEPKGNIQPSRGLRQGDPLSPFLFILLTEALISQLRGAEEEGRLTGLKIARASPAISHLLFADDSLFFCKADVQQAAELIRIINLYGRASGQLLNPAKSSISFGYKVGQEVKIAMKQTLGITKEGGMGMYLGLPEKICGSKRQVFAFIRDRLNDRINSWSAKLLSKGGKEGAIAKFWWSTKGNNRGLHWIAWEKICVPLEKGGLGFKDLLSFNLALLAKQLWRLLHHPNSLLACVLKGRYYRHISPMEVKKSNSPSYGWRSILAAQDLLREGLRKTIGSGYNTRFWCDPWIPTIPARPAIDIGVYRDRDLFVNQLIDQTSKQWRPEMLEALIDPGDITLIQNIRPSHSFRDDGYCWIHTKTGQYTVKSGYKLATQMKEEKQDITAHEPSINPLKAMIWKLKAPKKIQHFLWQVLSGCIATCSRLADRHCGIDRSCPRCGHEDESINHLLFLCPPALQTWALSDIPTSPGIFPSESLYGNFDYLLLRAKKNGTPEDILARFPWIAWFIWKARNEKTFNGNQIIPPDTVLHATREEENWRVAQVIENKEGAGGTQPSNDRNEEDESHFPRCQVDASWVTNSTVSEGGFAMDLAPDTHLYGSIGMDQVLSPIHAEFTILLHAMTYSLQLGVTSMSYQSDCLQLVKLINDEED
ncbi:uncharacterized protein LOC130511351 [Raphanus sativus]|uniref:Uncharacterized protein LOC130511351 n=1 Tax=Raphanus sativus TaxID=3726 RepID=A0A9W3DKI8_RAPSA|nr:uncharacterized protein LOC130511351 [Raphanus sativus]